METRNCQNCNIQFTIDSNDFTFFSKIHVPAPTWCPKCRFVRRLRARNERYLYKGVCGLCQKNIITGYNPKDNYLIYCGTCFQGDQWDPLSYGVDYDFSKPFFVQFQELLKKVPRRAVHGISPGVNTEYSNYLFNSKDAFLSYSVVNSEHIYHSRGVDNSKECVDCTNIKECESCYGNIQGTKNYNSSFLIDCRECIDCAFLYDCANCSNCFLSSNLRNKQYVFRNKQLTKEEYEKKIEETNTGSQKNIISFKEELKKIMREYAIHRFAKIFKSVNSSGNYIENSKNVTESYEIFGAEDSKYGWRLTDNPKDLLDIAGSGKSELAYDSVGIAWGTKNSVFINIGNATIDSFYSNYCFNVSNVFGSISVNKAQYVILNKQYTKEDYFEMVSKIKKHMDEMPYIDERGIVYKFGEFFPQICLTQSYNESCAQEYFPLDESEARKFGYLWREQEEKKNQSTITPDQVPDLISTINDDFLNEAIACSHDAKCKHQCTKAFRIHQAELHYLKKWNIAIPHECPNCRHYERNELRAPMTLFFRECMCDKEGHGHSGKCINEFETPYAPDRPEKVYCEDCYQKEVL